MKRFEDPDLTVQRLVPLGHHKIRRVPHKAADALQPIQVLLVLNLNRDENIFFCSEQILQSINLKCLAAVLTLLTLSLTILLKKNSGRSGMDFHVPRELMYFSLYLT